MLVRGRGPRRIANRSQRAAPWGERPRVELNDESDSSSQPAPPVTPPGGLVVTGTDGYYGGGGVADFDIERLRLLGRWESHQSLSHYVSHDDSQGDDARVALLDHGERSRTVRT